MSSVFILSIVDLSEPKEKIVIYSDDITITVQHKSSTLPKMI